MSVVVSKAEFCGGEQHKGNKMKKAKDKAAEASTAAESAVEPDVEQPAEPAAEPQVEHCGWVYAQGPRKGHVCCAFACRVHKPGAQPRGRGRPRVLSPDEVIEANRRYYDENAERIRQKAKERRDRKRAERLAELAAQQQQQQPQEHERVFDGILDAVNEALSSPDAHAKMVSKRKTADLPDAPKKAKKRRVSD